ncbi:uncharacterized protein LTR77_005451 [Saxophila tyrrhenica]|uniref:Uncharacterized protein n=1 Tax=Saxophila tyrrhenica TaxID=1690608 RepID=A0AAV9PCN5_9PEZI|nr:hypothetical protein LTR77_005451 [Saxophila tyrrhenica]
MGKEARVALYAPSALAPYVSLPSTFGGTTLYYSGTTVSGTSTWVSTALKGYTPKSIGPLTTYPTPAPTSAIILFSNKEPAASILAAAVPLNATVTPIPNGAWSGSASTFSTSTISSRSSATHSHPAQTITQTPTPAPSTGLSTGAKAGIGVGVAGGVIAAAALTALFVILRRRRNKEQPTINNYSAFPEKSAAWTAPLPDSPPNSGEYYHHSSFPAAIYEVGASPGEEEGVRKAISPPQPGWELDGEGASEMDGEGVISEMDGREPAGGEGGRYAT